MLWTLLSWHGTKAPVDYEDEMYGFIKGSATALHDGRHVGRDLYKNLAIGLSDCCRQNDCIGLPSDRLGGISKVLLSG
jgi:hypothetical protein